MRSTSLMTMVFLAGFGMGSFARSVWDTLQGNDTRVRDLAAIEKLHKAVGVFFVRRLLTQPPPMQFIFHQASKKFE